MSAKGIVVVALTSVVTLFMFPNLMRMFDDHDDHRDDVMRAKAEAYNIFLKSIRDFKDENNNGTFEDFLRAEWPQDYKLYMDGVRSYDEWKQLFHDASLQRSYEIPGRIGDTARGSPQE